MEPRPLSDILMPDAPFTDDDLVYALNCDGVDVPDGEAAEEQATKTLRWRPTSERSAEWALNKLIEYRTAIAVRAAEAQEMRMALLDELARIDAWEDKATRAPRSAERHFEHLLQEWALGQRTDRVKSIVLPSGIITTEDKKPAVEKVKGKDADERAVEWAEKRGVKINEKTEKSVNLVDLKPKVCIVDYIVKTHTGGDQFDPATWVWAPHVVADMVEVPPPAYDPEAPATTTWRFTDTKTGADLNAAMRVEGPFVVDADSGLPLDFLAVRRGGLSAEVVVTALD